MMSCEEEAATDSRNPANVLREFVVPVIQRESSASFPGSVTAGRVVYRVTEWDSARPVDTGCPEIQDIQRCTTEFRRDWDDKKSADIRLSPGRDNRPAKSSMRILKSERKRSKVRWHEAKLHESFS